MTLNRKKQLLIISFLFLLAVLSAEIRNVRVGFTEYKGVNEMTSDGIPSGYTVDFLKMVSRYVNLTFSYVGYDLPMSETTRMLRDGEIDMMFSTRKTDSRAAEYLFSVPIGSYDIQLSTRSSENFITPDDYSSYDGMRVGFLARSSNEAILMQFASEKNFSCQPVPMETQEELDAALRTRTIDALISSSLRTSYNEKVLSTISSHNMYMIFNIDNADLSSQINYACLQLDQDENGWRDELFSRYFTNIKDNELVFSSIEREYIRKLKESRTKIRASASPDKEPYSYVKNGELVGILPDIFHEYMILAGIEYELVVPGSTEEYKKLKAENQIDVWLDYENESFYAADDRFVTTPSFMEMNLSMLTNRDFHGEIKKCAVLKDRLGETLHMRAAPRAVIIPFKTREEAVKAVKNRTVDAAFFFAHYSAKEVSRDFSGNLTYSLIPDSTIHCSFAVPADRDHTIAGILAKCIHYVPESAIERIIYGNTSYQASSVGVLSFLVEHPIIPVTIIFFIVLVTVLMRYYSTKSELARKMYDQEKIVLQNKKEYYNIINTLGQEYNPLIIIDLTTDTYRLIRAKLLSPNKSPIAMLIPRTGSYTEFINKYIDRFVLPEQQESLRTATSIEKLRNYDGIMEFNYQRILRDQIDFYQATYSKIENSEGENTAIFGFRNINSIMMQEHRQKETLKDALFMAEQANRAKTAFLSSMSHEIRTPMNVIIGFIERIRDVTTDQKISGFVEQSLTSSRHLMALIDNSLNMSLIESGKMVLNDDTFTISELVSEINALEQPNVAAKHQTLRIDLSGIKDDCVISDKLKLKQVLVNIIGNAVKYTPAGGSISLSICQPELLRNGFGSYEFRIKDNGIGMSQDFIDKLYSPFEREHSSTVSKIQGTGLGMSITKNIIDMMNGTIRVFSEKGEGTEFIINLNLKLSTSGDKAKEQKVPAVAASPDSTHNTQPGQVSFDGFRVLLVEDNDMNSQIASGILTDHGFEVEIASNGAIAVSMHAESAPGWYDLILMDVQMPYMNGYEATRRIRSLRDRAKASVPIIAMTADAFDTDRKEALDSGMNAHVTKPISTSSLFTAIQKYLPQKKILKN